MKHSFAQRAAFGVAILLMSNVAAQAAEIKVLASGGFASIMQELGPKFERATGHKLVVATGSLGMLVKRVQDGETFDVAMTPRSAIDGFVKDGKAAAGDVSVVATAGMGVAVRAGAPKPDISSPDALKRSLLAAKSIAYPDPDYVAGNPALGIHLGRVFDRLGITGELKPKTVLSSTVDVGDMIAKGDAEIGIGQIQNLGRSKGIDIVGPLPRDLQNTMIFAATVMASSGNAEAAKALIAFMRTPDGAAAIRAQRMDPASP